MENHYESLKRIKDLSDIVLTELSEITGKTLNSFDLKFEMGGDNETDDGIVRVLNLIKDVNKKCDWRDIGESHTPGRLISKLQGKLANRLLKGNLTYLGKGRISVNPKVINESDETLKWMLAHEETHVLDDEEYNLFEIRYDFFKRWADLAEHFLEKKHKAGLIRGYIKPTESIKRLKKDMDGCIEEANRFMAVSESHAEFIQDRYVKHAKMEPTDYYSLRLLLPALVLTPLGLLSKQIRKKNSQYEKGIEIVKLTYEKGIDIGILYSHVPTDEDLKNPKKYFERPDIKNKYENN